MFKQPIRLSTGVLLLLVLSACSNLPGQPTRASTSTQFSPKFNLLQQSYNNDRRWIHPNGCIYSRVGRPGEITWILIINSAGPGKDCVSKIVQVPYPDDQPQAIDASGHNYQSIADTKWIAEEFEFSRR